MPAILIESELPWAPILVTTSALEVLALTTCGDGLLDDLSIATANAFWPNKVVRFEDSAYLATR